MSIEQTAAVPDVSPPPQSPPRQPSAAGRVGPLLPRRLGGVAAMGTLLGIIVGSGIFRTPSGVAALLPSTGPFLMVWVAGGLLALCGAMMFGELVAVLPDTGGRYVFLREGVSPLVGFVYAWSNVILLRPVSHGAIALVCGSYLAALIPGMLGRDRELAVATIALLAVLNYRSVRLTASTIIATTAAKLLAITVLAVLILLAPSQSNGGMLQASAGAPPFSWHAFGVALVAVMWAYSGWGSTTYLSGEVRRAERTMPLVLAGGVGAAMVLFLLVNFALLHAVPLSQMRGSTAVMADAAAHALGAPWRRIVAIVVVVSTFGSLNATSLASPRLPFAMGRDVKALRWLSVVHPRFATPYVAVVFTALTSSLLLWSHSFEQLARGYILGSWPFYILGGVALFRLRRLRPDAPRAFKVPGYPWVPALFIAAATAMVINAAVAEPTPAAWGSLIVLSSVPVWYLLRLRDRDDATESPPAAA